MKSEDIQSWCVDPFLVFPGPAAFFLKELFPIHFPYTSNTLLVQSLKVQTVQEYLACKADPFSNPFVFMSICLHSFSKCLLNTYQVSGSVELKIHIVYIISYPEKSLGFVQFGAFKIFALYT